MSGGNEPPSEERIVLKAGEGSVEAEGPRKQWVPGCEQREDVPQGEEKAQSELSDHHHKRGLPERLIQPNRVKCPLLFLQL